MMPKNEQHLISMWFAFVVSFKVPGQDHLNMYIRCRSVHLGKKIREIEDNR